MNRRKMIVATGSALMVAASVGAGLAATFADDVVSQLSKQGFINILSETTWLGRVRITANRNGGLREIVLNPRTGEILRDIWSPDGNQTGQVPIVDDVSGASGGGGTGSGSDGGSGGSGSGSGDGGSGSGDGGSGSGSGSGDGGGDHGGDGGGDHGGKDN